MSGIIDELTAQLTCCADTTERIRILSELLKEYSFVSDSDRILTCGTELLSLSRAEKDTEHEAAALIALGSHAQNENQYELALSRFSTALNLAKESGNTEYIMSALNNIGSVYYTLARYDKVLELCFEVLKLAEEKGSDHMIARARNNIGAVYSTMEDFGQARKWYSSAVPVVTRMKDTWLRCHLLNNLGNVSVPTGAITEALTYFREALAIAEEHSYTTVIIKSLTYLAEAALKEGDVDTALPASERALDSARTLGQSEELHRALHTRGLVIERAGNSDTAIACFTEALQIARDAGLPIAELETETILTRTYKERGNFREAFLHHEHVVRINAFRHDKARRRMSEELRLQYEMDKRKREAELFSLRNVELTEARSEAEKASKAKSRFLANISHELRSPMNGVLLTTELLTQTELSPEQQEYVHVITSSAEDLLRIINDIMSISKIEEGKIELKTERFNLEELVESVLNDCAARSYTNSLELIVRYPYSVPREYYGDQSRIFEAVANLVQNAIKFTPAGYILIAVAFESAGDASGMLHIEVTDTGIGISVNDQEKTFDTFTKAGTSDKSNFRGTGLGLAITRNLAKLMHGSLDVRSSLGKGTTFNLAIPLSSIPRKTADRQFGICRRILIVSDNSVLSDAINVGLSSDGLCCSVAEDIQVAQECLEDAAASGTPFDAVVINKPPHTKNEPAPDIPPFEIPCIVLQMPLEFRDSKNISANDKRIQVEKPVTPSRLEDVLQKNFPQPKSVVSHPGSPAAPLSDTSAETAGTQPQSYRILLVEDKEINQKVMHALLKKLGYDIEVASNGRVAIELLLKNRYDLVFMDCKMPVMDGYITTRQIRKLPTAMKTVPVVAMSAHALYGARDRCLAAGMDDYVSKPVSINDIKTVLERWLK